MVEINRIAENLNQTIHDSNPHILEMMSDMGKALYFPKGILTQSAEAKQKAHRINATIGIAREGGRVMGLPAVTECLGSIEPDDYLPYAPSFGVNELRKNWRQLIYRKNPSLAGKEISTPVVTSGVTHALSIFADIWVDPGDTVILPDMMWGNYNLILGVRKGAEVKRYRTFDDDLTAYNVDSFEQAVKAEGRAGKKVMVLLNFPHNPSGYSPTVEEGERIAQILINQAEKGTNVVAAFDDSYFGLYYEDRILKESLFSILAGSHERVVAVKLDGATKEDYVWGFRTGFLTYAVAGDRESGGVYDALERKTAGCIRGNISNASNLSQALLLKALNHKEYQQQKTEKYTILRKRALAIKETLKTPSYPKAWDVYPFNSGYFMCLRLKDVNAEDLRIHLLEKYGTGLIAIGDRNLRIAFSCIEENDIPLLFETILKGVNDLKNKLGT